MCIWLMEHTSDKTLLTYTVNVARKHYMVWAAMGVLTQFSQAILAKVQRVHPLYWTKIHQFQSRN